MKKIIDLDERIVAQTHGPGRVPVPSQTSMNRLVNALSDPAEPLGRARRGQPPGRG
ncbi:hypothetical protein ACFU98_42370 [Streptomyces sp. NPDC057575]|uniref:hypothetical protein n=1 Tax=unclassified Streptomyces TaxID=2593676 RepID=UPI0036B7E7A4